jgi:hypothetical protein
MFDIGLASNPGACGLWPVVLSSGLFLRVYEQVACAVSVVAGEMEHLATSVGGLFCLLLTCNLNYLHTVNCVGLCVTSGAGGSLLGRCIYAAI